jgi:predicted transcriptional regulator
MAPRREMGALEGEILVLLWGSDRPLSAVEVHAAIGEGLAHTSVLTVLTRLWRKDLVQREAHGRSYRYWPAVSEAQLTAQRMRAQLERAADRQQALTSFVGSLSDQDEQALRAIVERIDGRH